MDLTKRYYDEDGNPCNVLEMVRNCPEWAAARVQEGERAIRTVERTRGLKREVLVMQTAAKMVVMWSSVLFPAIEEPDND